VHVDTIMLSNAGRQSGKGSTLLEYGQRAFDNGGANLNDSAVHSTGCVADAGDGAFQLARRQIAVASSPAMVVRVVGTAVDPVAWTRDFGVQTLISTFLRSYSTGVR
jgi:hypothetical protein